ncbi:MAG: rhamnulokinase [Eubacteriales bacterium]|nr:rhamnulokinase [Eubacteriales bacterium]
MNVLAFDFGASSGRAILGSLKDGKLTLKEIHRFDNEPVYMNGGLYWDLPRLFHEVKQGILKAKEEEYESIGIDTWGVDYALITKDGKLIGNPYNYRDERTLNTRDKVGEIISDEDLYKTSGIQTMNINTLFQFMEDKEERDFYELADKFILVPDLFGYLLTGKVYSERTMASTTQLLDPYTKEWNFPLIEKLVIKKSMFPRLVDAGERIGALKEEICKELDIGDKYITAVAGHDTASAVVAVPAQEKDFVYISCGTWSLFGTELDKPCISDLSAQLNITNETGYEKTTRFLKNIIGLWMIQETRRQFGRDGKDYSYADMEMMAREAQPFKCFIDPDDPRFIPPGNQVQRIKDFCMETNQPIPETDGAVVRCIYESLAMKYKYTFENLKKCTGQNFETIHMVGGGTKDNFLCSMTASATGANVVAGPIEATAAGNIVVQLISAGEIKDLKEAREIIANSFDVVKYEPTDDGFDKEYDRFLSIIK